MYRICGKCKQTKLFHALGYCIPCAEADRARVIAGVEARRAAKEEKKAAKLERIRGPEYRATRAREVIENDELSNGIDRAIVQANFSALSQRS